MVSSSNRHRIGTAAAVLALTAALGAQTAQKPYEPVVGQGGKDAVWVPTGAAMVEKMLDHAKVTPQDFVIDLGSGDGRTIIAAARRGARGLGVEYNPDLVEFSRRQAAAAGVADKASFAQGDMYAADISKATVLALFLLPSNIEKLVPKFLELPPGTRIVANTFWVPEWTPDDTQTLTEGLRELVHVAPLHRPRESRGPVARRRRRGGTDAEVPDGRGHIHARDGRVRAGEGAAAGQRHHGLARADRVRRHRERKHDGGRGQVGAGQGKIVATRIQ